MAKLKSGTTIDGNTAWHAGNDGTGSGLSADNLRGYLPSETASANSIAKRNGDGDLTVTDLHASKVLSENVTTTPDKIGNIKIARLHGTTTAISNINNLDTFILSKTDGGYGSGTKPSGTHNGFGVISLQTHTGNYYTQLGLDTNQNALWIRSANGTTSYGSWQRAFADNYHPNADKLTTARTIAGVSFDGTANISLNNNAITNGAGYTTNTGTVTNVTVGTGLDVTNGTTTPSITLDLSEFTSMTDDVNGLADELILLDGGAERRKTISSIKLSQFNNDAGWSSRRPVTAGGNSLASSESLDFIAGTGITISESGGDVTISASGGGGSGTLDWSQLGSVTVPYSTSTTSMSISPSNGLDSIIAIEVQVFSAASPATWTGPLDALSASSTYKAGIWAGSTQYANFYRNSTGTSITFSGAPSANIYNARVYEIKVV